MKTAKANTAATALRALATTKDPAGVIARAATAAYAGDIAACRAAGVPELDIVETVARRAFALLAGELKAA